MNDKTIINIISKIHFIFISALSFIFLTSSILFIILQNGLYLESISLPNIKAKKLYIKWNEKINLLVEDVNISKKNSSVENKVNYAQINNLIKSFTLFDNCFEQISIKKINYNDIQASLRYTEAEKGFLKASSPDFIFNSSIYVQDGFFTFHIDKYHHYTKDIKINGDLILNNRNLVKLTSSIKVNIHNDIEFDLYSIANDEKLFYKINSLKGIKDIKHTIDLFNFDKRLKYWVYDAIDMSSLYINKVTGYFEYEKMDEAIKNLHIKAVAKDFNYTYHKKIDSIYTKYTNFEFKNGVLYIRPKDTYTYGIGLDDSWLKIDFVKKQEILTLHLLFDGTLNDDMLHVLNTYKIKLPFKQTKGKLDTKLKLVINLQTIDVDAVGKFTTKEAQINYLGLNIDVYDTEVDLNNFDVKVKDMLAKYKDIATADVDLDFNAKDSQGTMDFKFKKITLIDQDISLDQNKLNVSYLISKKQDYINIDKSNWKFLDEKFKINALKVPFNLKKLTAEIPLVKLEADKSAYAQIQGRAILKPLNIDLGISLKHLNLNGLALDQKSADFKLKVNEKLELFTNDEIKFKYDDIQLRADNFWLNIINNRLTLNNLFIDIDNKLNSKFSVLYNLDEEKGFVNLHKINVSNNKIGEIFQHNINSKIDIDKKDNQITLHSDKFNIDYLLFDHGWKLSLYSLDNIYEYSNILQKYKLKDGELTFYKQHSEQAIKFSANINYPYKILVTNDIPLNEYTINGEFGKDDKVSLKINNTVDINIDKNIKINADNVGINIDETLKLLEEHSGTNKDSKINLNLYAKDCFIFFTKGRHAISDNINLQYNNNTLKAQLSHEKGMAWFELKENNKFRLYGNNFGDKFMQNIFASSEFKGGSLEFSMHGHTQNYSGIIYMQDTTVYDYRLLNNVLAFVNTIPSLVTFSLPGYNKNGLHIDNAYMSFKAKDSLYKINNMSMKSKEINIIGKGDVSIKDNSINLDLNLKTDLGSAVSKIPLVGYILLDKDTISASLKVKGKLNDPKVSTTIVKDMAVAPLNIIKRTFLLPYNLITGKNKK